MNKILGLIYFVVLFVFLAGAMLYLTDVIHIEMKWFGYMGVVLIGIPVYLVAEELLFGLE